MYDNMDAGEATGFLSPSRGDKRQKRWNMLLLPTLIKLGKKHKGYVEQAWGRCMG